MSLLNASHLSFRHPAQADWLFSEVSFEINPRDRIGLIGPNGSGKTTLLRLLTGELRPNAGIVIARQGLRPAYVPQESLASDTSPLDDVVFAAHPGVGPIREELRALEVRLNDPASAGRYATLLSAYEAQGGFQAESETVRVLEGLGFDARERQLPTGRLSSGQRARADLAKLLLSPADLLLIDEPTNHLDVQAQAWLEGYLARLDVAYLMVSHDRTFLNRAVTRIFELQRGRLQVFEGGYESYREQRAVQERHAWERYDAQQRRAAAAEKAAEKRMRLARKMVTATPEHRRNQDPYQDSFYNRKAGKVQRTARILRERVTREPEVPRPWVEDPIPTLRFPDVRRTSDQALSVEGLTKAYGAKRLFEGLSFSVRRGERWAILGPNGSGKTTLLRILLRQDAPNAGQVEFGAHVKLGYYAQEGEDLDPAKSPVDLCRDIHGDETRCRTILGCLRLRGQRANQPVGTMSAGERSKVALARLLLGGANLLLLDEPTNHLDIEAREAAEATLAQFPGTILFVSHDRAFAKALADRTLDLSPGLKRES